MGLIVEVYRSKLIGDCTNNGISGRADSLCLVNVSGPFNPHQRAPAALLIKGIVSGTVRIVPAMWCAIGEWAPATGWWMMGGNYAATSDSRFNEAIEEITRMPFYGAVPIHDRQE